MQYNSTWTDEEIKELISQQDEIMAYAWQITDSLKQKGLSNEKCRKLLQSEDDKKLRLSHDALTQYHKFFTIQDFELKLLYKYMYLYLED